MNEILVGHTGFVGSNLAAAHAFAACYHSTDVAEAYGSRPGLLVYSGMPAAMYLANAAPERDRAAAEQAMENIRRIAPERVALISTVAVYPRPDGADEATPIEPDALHTYGRHRFLLEEFVRREFPGRHLVARLPALFGRNLKKNFIYDYIHVIPSRLSTQALEELAERDGGIRDFYDGAEDGYFRCRPLSAAEREALKGRFLRLGFTALRFTDSRSVYQFYHLAHLWGHISRAMELGIPLLNAATEPLAAADVYRSLCGREFRNELSGTPCRYNVKSRYADALGGSDGYLLDAAAVLREIAGFVQAAGRGEA